MEFKLVLNRIFICGILFTALFFSSCVSTQKDVSISAEDTQNAAMVIEFEKRLIKLDGEFVLNGKLSLEQKNDASAICADIDKSLKTPMLDKVVESRLLALKGRTLLISGNKIDANKMYNQAKKKFSNDVQLAILGRRLGNTKNISTYKNQFESEAITIEAAIESFENGEYDIATGFFDSAFLASNGFYQNAYSAIRERAWNLKNIDSDNTNIAFWLASKITIGQMMELAQKRPGLLEYYTGGRKMDSQKLFKTLLKAGLMNSISGTQETQSKTPILESTIATRILAARFLWNLYANTHKTNATKYSERYRSRANAKSPVADIEISSEDFDAILGVVEKEIMSLVDGKNFNPEGTVTAPEFDASLKKIQ